VRIENGVLAVERDGEPRFERPIELIEHRAPLGAPCDPSRGHMNQWFSKPLAG
jgi:hypothetical protein